MPIEFHYFLRKHVRYNYFHQTLLYQILSVNFNTQSGSNMVVNASGTIFFRKAKEIISCIIVQYLKKWRDKNQRNCTKCIRKLMTTDEQREGRKMRESFIFFNFKARIPSRIDSAFQRASICMY